MTEDDHQVDVGTKVTVGGQLGEVVRAEPAVSHRSDNHQDYLASESPHSGLSAPLSSLRLPCWRRPPWHLPEGAVP